MSETKREKCSLSSCENGSSFMRKDCLGTVHRACTTHSKYLEGWVHDVNAEVRSESRASAAYERQAYGDD